MKFHNYFIYITTNPQRTVLYTGVTNDINLRMDQHRMDSIGKKISFAGKYHCYNLIYHEYYSDIRIAIAREKEIKGWSRKKKVALIASFNPDWRFLNDPAEIAKGDLPIDYC